MTSRDFGFTTLRSAVAYRRNNTLVPPNNVYVTSTNGAAIFSDTLTISTINVSTINGGGGGSQTLSQTGNIVSLNPSGSMVDIASTTLVSSTGVKTTHQALVGSNTEFGGGCVCIRSNNGLSVGLIGGDTIDIYEGVISGIDSGFNLGGTLAVKSIQDNSSTIGTAGQLLTAGAGGELLWSTISGGGGQVLSQSGDNILLSGGGGSVDVSQTTTVSTTTQKTTALTYNAGIQLSNFSSNLTVGAPGAQTIRMIDGDIGLIGNATQVRFVNTSNNTVGYLTYTSTSNDLRLGSALPLKITSESTITLENITGGDIILNSQAGRFRTLAIDGRMDFVGGDLIITASGHNIDIIAAATRFRNMINVSSMLNDNNGVSGTAGQVLTAGTGGQVIWSTISGGGGGGSVNSVSSGINISTSGTVSDPIINVYINSTLLMNGFPIYDNSTITIASGSIINLSTVSTSIVLNEASTNITITASTGVTINGFETNNALLTVNGNTALIANSPRLDFIDNSYDGNGGSLFYDKATTQINLAANSGALVIRTQGVGATAIEMYNPTITLTGNTIINNNLILNGAINDNSNLSGTSGQVLTAGSGGQVIWSTISGGGSGSVNSVSSGINISTSGTATNPIINVYINSTLDMNLQNITNGNQIELVSDTARVLLSDATNTSKGDLNYTNLNNKISLGALGSGTKLALTTASADLDLNAVGGHIQLLATGNPIEIATNVDGLGVSGNIKLTANGTGDIDIGTGGNITMNAPIGDVTMYSQQITLSTLTNLNMNVGSTINMTGGSNLISSNYLVLTINNASYKIALL